jgi:glucan endo-1,3-alpha-glucosidase
MHLAADSPTEEVQCPAVDTDRHHLRHLGGRTYMAAVSPWFFAVRTFFIAPRSFLKLLCRQHYGPDSWNKNVGHCPFLVP